MSRQSPRSDRKVPAISKADERLSLFATAYIICKFNGYQAAVSIGVPPAGAMTWASRALRNSKVQSDIHDKLEQLKTKHDLTADTIILELKKIGFSNLEDFTRLTEDGLRVIDMSTATREQLAAVGELSVEEDVVSSRRGGDEDDAGAILKRRTKIKLHDKKSALVDLLKFVTGNLGRFDGAVINQTTNNVTNLTQVNNQVTVKGAISNYEKMLDQG